MRLRIKPRTLHREGNHPITELHSLFKFHMGPSLTVKEKWIQGPFLKWCCPDLEKKARTRVVLRQ